MRRWKPTLVGGARHPAAPNALHRRKSNVYVKEADLVALEALSLQLVALDPWQVECPNAMVVSLLIFARDSECHRLRGFGSQRQDGVWTEKLNLDGSSASLFNTIYKNVHECLTDFAIFIPRKNRISPTNFRAHHMLRISTNTLMPSSLLVTRKRDITRRDLRGCVVCQIGGPTSKGILIDRSA